MKDSERKVLCKKCLIRIRRVEKEEMMSYRIKKKRAQIEKEFYRLSKSKPKHKV